MKRFFKFINNWMDDVSYMLGVVCLTIGVFKIYAPAGYITLGSLLILYAILIARR